jgi:transcriptional regulator with XRE-family HTH domain
MNLQEALKNERISRNMTQRDLANKLDVYVQTINMLENGKTSSDKLLLKLEKFYKLEKNYFLKIKYENNK